ncbi:tetratricopeptide repeat protein [Caballeronia sp. J97]|uniref:tetratricopeptide repeat protein n=1 Tax=Caballeronia sp. J97 TaxID=2805429 RepID=UPI002AB2604D|nr:tetratricopeptide repeat protein [Caballeronia sp. J97]
MQEALHSAYGQAVHAYNNGQWQTAVHWIERCLSFDSENADLLHFRGLCALALDDAAEGERWILKAIERSASPVFYNSLSVAQTRLRAFADAADSARAGLKSAAQWRPEVDRTVLLYNLGRALQLDGRLEEAAAAYREVLELDPDHAGAQNNLGAILNTLGEFDAGIAHFRRALDLAPGNLEAHSNLGHALLAAGRYRDAWPHFEHRWSTFQDETGRPETAAPNLPIPQWKGDPVRPDRDRLLILNEQGLGDSLQFSRYIPMAMKRFAKVGFAGPEPLRRLFTDSFARSGDFLYLDARHIDLKQWDMFCPLMSMPLAFDTDVDSVPASIPYLHARAHAVRRWSARLVELGDGALPRIGLAWAGGRFRPDVDARRSIGTEQIDTLISWPHARWISLQKPVNDAKKLLPRQRMHVVDWMDEIEDFADTAALVSSLDLVICVDTSVAHLAGALDKPVWMLNRHRGCWRWMRGREDTPWYPNMRIFNQTERDNWDEVLERVLAELELAGWRR